MFPYYSTVSLTHRFALALADGLKQELELTPKPGLVDQTNNGSHPDLSYELMSRSVELLEDYFVACAVALEAGSDVETLRELGKATERTMYARFGTNTHRGAIFLGGLMLSGVYSAGCLDSELTKAAVSTAAKRLFEQELPSDTVGAQVRARFSSGGIVDEAINGLPSVFETGVPALRSGLALGMSREHAQLLAMAVLMQRVEDTTALRRCGCLGLIQLREDGRRLEACLRRGICPNRFLGEADRRYRARRLTMGGVADMLGMCIAWHSACQAGSGTAKQHPGIPITEHVMHAGRV